MVRAGAYFRRPEKVWAVLLILAFLPGAASWMLAIIIYPPAIGSHANIYTAAAAAWMAGGDPWTVGPQQAIYAGPPPMLLPFLPFVGLPIDVTRFTWFAADVVLAIWVTRRLGLPAYWLSFPPLFDAIFLGHIEVLILALIVLPGPLSGLAIAIKPYAAFPLLAERRFLALAVGVLVVVVTAPFLPWARFASEFSAISANLSRQSHGDSVFGDPLLMAVAAVALLALGIRRALWLGVPVLWPAAQPIYKTMTVPALTPIIALAWALPIPGATLAGIVAQAALERLDRRRPIWPWLKYGLQPASSVRRAETPHLQPNRDQLRTEPS
jgi:hypothetical protein